ncbi:uncharacterized protein [Elaeis guineensis]|uniref:uncharacterized protein n=1 Tax=Elaeis guineensis var. tenera TaxID=51953 RepID=UPI003C6D6F82
MGRVRPDRDQFMDTKNQRISVEKNQGRGHDVMGGRREAAITVDSPSDVELAVPRASLRSPPIEVPAPEARSEEAPRAERRRRKKTLARKSHSSRAAIEEADGFVEDSGENPFNNRDLIKRLVDGCILPEVIHRTVHIDPEQRVWDSLGSFLEIGHQLIANIEVMNNARKEATQAEEGRLIETIRLKEKIVEVVSLQEVLQKEGQTSADLRATLEEERKKAEVELSELKAQILTLVSEAMVQAVEEFKTSSEMRDLKVEFGQAAFIKGFELYQEVVRKFSKLDLDFLDEASNDKVGLSEAAAGLPPVQTSLTAVAVTADLLGALSSPLLPQRSETSNFVFSLFFFVAIFSHSLVLKNYLINEIRFFFIEGSPILLCLLFLLFYFLALICVVALLSFNDSVPSKLFPYHRGFF